MIRLAPSLSNFAQHSQPRITSVKRQPTTRAPAPRGFRALVPTATITARPKPRAPAAPSAAAPAAAAASLPALTPLPPDASYEQQVAAAGRNRDQTLAALGQQRTGGLQEFGYTETAPGQVQFDANNPFSRAALLRKNYQQAQRGNVTGMAARGQLYSGALQNSQDYSTRGFNEGENSLQRALIAFLSQNTQRGSQAQTDYQSQLSEADAARVQRAQDSALYQAQLAAAAASAAPPADTGGGAPASAAATPGPAGSVQHDFKRVNGVLYRRIKGSNQQWVKVG